MQFGMLGLKLLEAVHQPVEGGVGNFGIVRDVIEVFVAANFLAQALDFFGCRLACIFSLDFGMETSAGCSRSKSPSIIQCAIAPKLWIGTMPDGIKDALLIYNPTSGRSGIAGSRKSSTPRAIEGCRHRHGARAHHRPRAAASHRATGGGTAPRHGDRLRRRRHDQ